MGEENKVTYRMPDLSADFIMDLVPHPEGRFHFEGKPYRPEWGKTPKFAETEDLGRMVAEGLAKFAECRREDCRIPKYVHVTMFNGQEPVAFPRWH